MPTSDSVDRVRFNELASGTQPGLLLRSASSLTSGHRAADRRWRASLLVPEVLAVDNSALSFSQNYGALWAGKGVSTRTIFGFTALGPAFRLLVAPEFVTSANSDWALDTTYYKPPLPDGFNEWVFPYYVGRFTIDQPLRMGDRRIRRLDAGESGLFLELKAVEFGVSNENEWWGPGLRNALILSNNAPGFPHLTLRTRRPLATRIGEVDFRWLVGGLTESKFFDFDSSNNSRSLAAIAATVRMRFDPNLTLGLARSVFAPSRTWGQAAARWLDVFASTSRSNSSAAPDSLRSSGGRDQLIAVFGRWVFPESGAEVYAEIGRTELPRNLRDLLVAPNHTQGYTIGAQWRTLNQPRGSVRLQAEITQTEQSATFRDRPVGSWYTSQSVIQGYTNRGEVLGSSVGPGASSQWTAADYLAPSWRAGVFAGRIRWNEDVHSNYGFPGYVAYCNHDVSLYSGLRGAKSGMLGRISADLTLQNRINAFFQNAGGCPNNGRRLDIRNTTLSVTYSPFFR